MTQNHIDLGDKLWFFPSPRKTNVCLIMAHGGTLEGHVQFKVPQGVTVSFAVARGKDHVTNATQALGSQEFSNSVRGGGMCDDLSLAKFMGGHGDVLGYRELRELQVSKDNSNKNSTFDSGAPHIVSIRRRSFITGNSKLIKLSEVIDLVQQHDQGINVFNVNACRGERKGRLRLMKATLFGI